MPYITPEDMTPGMKLLMTDMVEIIGEQCGITRGVTYENILHPHATDDRLGPRVRQCEVLSAVAGMHTELEFDQVSYEVIVKVPGHREPFTVHLGADWMIRQPLSTTY